MSSSDSDASSSANNSNKRASSSNSDAMLPTSNSEKRTSPSSSNASKKRVSTDDILNSLTATGRQKKMKLSDVLLEYRTAGRKAVLTLNPFASVSLTFHYGMMLDKGGVSNSNISDEQQARYRTFYNGILDMVPGFRATLDEISYDELKPYITAINSAMSSQRSDDFASLKHPMLEYILTNRNSDTLQPPIPKSSCKSNRGTNHPRLARELCPRKWLDKFDIDVDLGIQRLQDGTWPLLSTNWPSFLYAADAIYDSEDPNIGLFRGHAGIRAFQHLYLGPAAAGSEEHNDDDSKHGRSKSKATMYGLTKVTPQAWAWAMCAAWFSLSACNSYKVCIGSFNLEDFFFAIIETLDDPEDPWAVDTMAWINEQVFGKHAAKAMTAAADDTDSDLAKMRAKRAARKQGSTLTSATNIVVRGPITSPPSVPPAECPSSPAPPLIPPRPPLQATPSTSSPPRALTPLSDSESFPPSPAKQPPAIPTAVLPKPVPVAHKKAKPVPRPKPVPKAKPVPKPRSNTRISARLSAGAIQVEEPTTEAGDAGILDVNAPAPPKKKPVARRGKKAA
ncbi:hypothetical protein BD769DRAFT_1782539 [Suillus cothurnatus]|nr:hypothetical protein BD769DRAFT_1782539 [Suillus cothurnatus]